MSLNEETRPAPAMKADQLRSDMETIRTVLTDRDRSNEIHRLIIAAGNFVCGGLLLIAIPFLMIPIGVVGIANRTAADSLEPSPVFIVGGVLGTVIFFLAVLSLPFLFAGWGVLRRRSWGQAMAMVAGILNFLNVPLGTTFGIYTLWVIAKGKLPAQIVES